MDAHPGVLFREGPAGRRAVLSGGPDVWEVVRAITLTRAAEPDLGADEIVATVSENTGLPEKLVQVAIAYYANYPDDIDALLADADRAELDAAEFIDRRRALLGA